MQDLKPELTISDSTVKQAACIAVGVPERPALAEGRSLAKLEMAVAELFRAVKCALRDEPDVAEQSMQKVATLLEIDVATVAVAHPAASSESPRELGPGGLAPWQIRHVRTHIASNLGATIRTQDLATIAGLSPFHFSRAFRGSFGDSPHSYLLHRRIEHSQGLMLTTNAPLSEIALDCGLVDQAHFGKLFRRLVGESPGAWRRARTTQRDVVKPAMTTPSRVLQPSMSM